MPELVPIFPLDTVLMPGAPLPLHIFEPRYRVLVNDVWDARQSAATPAFGIIAVRSLDSAADVRGPGRAPTTEAADLGEDADGGSGQTALASIGTLVWTGWDVSFAVLRGRVLRCSTS